MEDSNKDYFNIIASVDTSEYKSIPDWTTEAFIMKRTLSYSSSNGSKSVIIKIEDNARWSRKTHKGQ